VLVADTALLADKRLRQDDATPSQAATVEKQREAGPMLGLRCMPMTGKSPSPAFTPTGKSMAEVWLWLNTPPNNGVVPSTLSNKQHKNLINLVDSWFKHLALPQEVDTLRSPTSDEGNRLRIVDHIDMLVAQVFKVCERLSVRACVRAQVLRVRACERAVSCIHLPQLSLH